MPYFAEQKVNVKLAGKEAKSHFAPLDQSLAFLQNLRH